MRKLNLDWLRDTRTGLSIFCCLIFCIGIGLGMFFMYDIQGAKIRKVEAEKEILTQNLIEATFLVEVLDMKITQLTMMIQKLIKDKEKVKSYNDTALEGL